MAGNNTDEHVKGLRENADDAARLARKVYITFLLVGTYIAVTIGSTTDIQLLTASPVKLPIVNVPLPIVGFYLVVPWLLLLLHFNLLLQLYLLSRKLYLVDTGIEAIKYKTKREAQRALLFPFPFSQVLIGRQRGRVMRALLAVIVWTTMIVLPLALLVWAQIAFLPYHDETITWSHRAALVIDVALLWVFWPMIMAPSGRVLDWWRGLAAGPGRLLGRTMWWRKARDERPPQAGETARGAVGLAVLSLFALVLSLLTTTVPGEGLEGWVAADGLHFLRVDADAKRAAGQEVKAPEAVEKKSPEAAEKLAEARAREDPARKALDEATERRRRAERRAERCQRLGGNCFVLTFVLFDRIGAPFHRNLRLAEAVLVAGEPSPETIGVLRGEDEAAREKELRKVAGLNLANRDLRFADLRNALLPKADLRGANLDGSDLRGAKLFGADFRPFDVTEGGACAHDHPPQALKEHEQSVAGIEPPIPNGRFCPTSLDRARLDLANLSKFNLAFARLQGADLSEARLQGADLRQARLQGADLREARLQGADLRQARLQGADLRGAELHGADLRGARLQGADLRGARLQRADLSYSELQGADLSVAELQGADLSVARLQGADLSEARLQGADLSEARLQGADLSEARLQGADLSEARLQGADLSEARLQGADLRQAKLQGADLRGAAIGGAKFNFANLNLVDLRGVNRKPLTESGYLNLKQFLAMEVGDETLRKRILDTLKKAIDRLDNLEKAAAAKNVLCNAFWLLPGNACPSKQTVAEYDKNLVDKVLRSHGCGEDADPAIALRLARHAEFAAEFEDDRPLGPLLASALLDPKCKGGAALPVEIKAALEKIVQREEAADKR